MSEGNASGSKLCKLGLHHFVDFPDPNPETQGMREAQGYRACMRCVRTKDTFVYEPRLYSPRVKSWWFG